MNRFFLLISALAAGASMAHATTLFVAPVVVVAPVGAEVTFTVNVTSIPDILDPPQVFGFDMAIQYPSFLTFESATEQGFFATNGVLGLFALDAVDTPGYITGLEDVSSTVDDQINLTGDPLFSLTFLVNDVGSDFVSIVCDGTDPNDCTFNPMLSDGNFNSIPVDGGITDASIISFAAPTPEPSFALLIAALAGLLMWRQQRFRARPPGRME
jgi:hypothetical protein